MKVLITGAAGQLGTDLQVAFADSDVTAVDIEQGDITKRDVAEGIVDDAAPDVIVHSAAFTAVDACETRAEDAWAVNTTGTMWLANAAARRGAKIVYISTDYVFDGTLGRPYTEFDAVNPRSVYGRTKEAGEQVVRRATADHVIVRTQWVHGSNGANFAKTMLRLGREKGAVSVVDDQTGSPTFTFDLAPQIRRIVKADLSGTFHVTNTGHCTWFEFARAIFTEAGMDVDLTPTDTATFNAPAHRPAYSVLDNLMTRQTGLPTMPAWQQSLKALLGQIG